MDNRIAILGIFVYSAGAVEKLNDQLHDYSRYIVGRMGLPYREKQVSVISIIIDAPGDVIGALSGKLGMIPDISVKTIYAKSQPSAGREKCLIEL